MTISFLNLNLIDFSLVHQASVQLYSVFNQCCMKLSDRVHAFSLYNGQACKLSKHDMCGRELF